METAAFVHKGKAPKGSTAEEGNEVDMEVMAREAEEVFSACVDELKTAGQLPAGSVVVLGCSTSEVAGAKIGKGSVPELGAVIARAMIAACAKHGLRAAFQCCEHLNRAVVMEREVLKEYGCVQVRAIPQPKAGGSVPAAAWKQLREPVLAQAIQADAAIDVGDTLVGMHIRPVAVPLRGAYRRLGSANLVQAYSRLPYIGGARAVYE